MITSTNLAEKLTTYDSPGLGRVILAIDDDRIQLGLVRAQLECAGFVVAAADGEKKALEIAKSRRIDAILSDVVMSEGDGFSLCRVLRDIPLLKQVPIILISADFRERADRALAQTVGANDLVARTPDLQEAIEALVRGLAEGPPSQAPNSVGPMPDLYKVRIAHQLVELRKKSTVAEARYEMVFEHASDAISLQSVDGTILDVNHRWEEIQQRSRHEMVGHNLSELVPPEHAEATLSEYLRMVASGEFHTHAVPITRKDGTTVHIEFTNTPIDIDGERTMLSIGRDVTERFESERKLAASERKYRTIVENIPDVIWSATPAFQPTFLSPNVLKLLGFTAEEMTAQEHGAKLNRIHPDDLPEFHRRSGALTGGESAVLDTEFRWRHRDGHWVWLHVRAVRATDSNGSPCVDGVFTDITSRKVLEEQLLQAQKLEAVGRLTAGIAHDFNNILAVILTNAEFLLQALPEGGEPRSDAQEIKESAERAATLTRQLLSFSRRQVHEPRCLDLRTVVSGVQRMLCRMIGEDVALTVNAPLEPTPIHADPGKLEQVLMNLAVNSRDAMPNGGALTISTENVTIPTEVLGGPPAGSWVMLSVRDTGTGMSPETRARIFEPFFTTKDVGRGTGLGLSTSYGIVRESGGQIVVESEPGVGTVFKIYFPRVAAVGDKVPSTKKESASPRARAVESILVVEDDPLVRSLVRRILSREGYEVTCASDALEALATVERGTRYDLVMSDMVIPGMNGPELIEKLRAKNPAHKAMLMSGYSDHAALHAARNAGIPILDKPFQIVTLVTKVRAALDG